MLTRMIILLTYIQNRPNRIQEKQNHRMHKWLYSIRSRNSSEWVFKSVQSIDLRFYLLYTYFILNLPDDEPLSKVRNDRRK